MHSPKMLDGNEPQVSLTREDILTLVQAVAEELAPKIRTRLVSLEVASVLAYAWLVVLSC